MMKSFYYLCTKCAYDTAVYGEMHRCPSCHAGQPDFELFGTSDDEDILQKLQVLRIQGAEKMAELLRAAHR